MRFSFQSGIASSILNTIANRLQFSNSGPAPVKQGLNAFYTGGPAAKTLRNTQTVGAGEVWKVRHLSISWYRLTAATVASYCRVYVDIYNAVGSSVTFEYLVAIDNNVGVEYHKEFPIDLTLFEGDNIRFSTEDLSTGGTGYFRLSGIAEIVDVV